MKHSTNLTDAKRRRLRSVPAKTIKEDEELLRAAREAALDIEIWDLRRVGVSVIRIADRKGMSIADVRKSLTRSYASMRVDEAEVRDFINLEIDRLDEVSMYLNMHLRTPKLPPEATATIARALVTVSKQRQSYIVGARAPLAVTAQVTVSREDIASKLSAYLEGVDDGKKEAAGERPLRTRPRARAKASSGTTSTLSVNEAVELANRIIDHGESV